MKGVVRGVAQVRTECQTIFAGYEKQEAAGGFTYHVGAHRRPPQVVH